MTKRDIFDLRREAQARGGADYRADDLTSLDSIVSVRVETSVNQCDCGNLLTITDPGDICRQCVLQARAEMGTLPFFKYNGKEIH